eukprot:143638-Rhodomonas_salina.2
MMFPGSHHDHQNTSIPAHLGVKGQPRRVSNQLRLTRKFQLEARRAPCHRTSRTAAETVPSRKFKYPVTRQLRHGGRAFLDPVPTYPGYDGSSCKVPRFSRA